MLTFNVIVFKRCAHPDWCSAIEPLIASIRRPFRLATLKIYKFHLNQYATVIGKLVFSCQKL